MAIGDILTNQQFPVAAVKRVKHEHVNVFNKLWQTNLTLTNINHSQVKNTEFVKYTRPVKFIKVKNNPPLTNDWLLTRGEDELS